MSIRQTIEKNVNAALALIAVIGYAIQHLLGTWPEEPPTVEWVVIILGLGVCAFFFYREDKNFKKDPGIREATVTAATDDLMNTFAEVLVERVIDKVTIEGKEETAKDRDELQAEIDRLKKERDELRYG